MARQIYKKINGKYEWLNLEEGAGSSVAPAVHDDSFKEPLKHPVTDEIVDSASRWNRINKENGLECVGNDLLSRRERHFKDHVGDREIRDAMEQTEAIYSDPSKRRAWLEMNRKMTASHMERLKKD